jgi:hypothetical protein
VGLGYGQRVSLDQLTVESFKPAVGSKFALNAGDDTKLELELVDAQANPPQGGAGQGPSERTPFSLTFRGPAEPVLPQQIYPLEHGELGKLEIFVVPIGVDAGGASYEAIFA